MGIESDYIWLDGELVPYKDANVHILTHSLHYGLGAFEGIRCYKRADGRSAIFRLREHIQRLFESCLIATIPMDEWTVEQIEDACIETIKANKFEDCYIRPMTFLGDGEMGLAAMTNKIRVTVICWPWGAYLGDEGLQRGIRAKVSSFNRHHVNASMVKGKITGQYVNSILAKREVKKAGYDEAIMLDTDGYISEASGQNIFMIKNGVVYTTPLGSSILGGITRDTVVTMLKEMGANLVEQNFTRDMLYTADEVFLVGTAAEVTPVREIDDRKVGVGSPGPVTKEVQAAYFDMVKGSAADKHNWLTYID